MNFILNLNYDLQKEVFSFCDKPDLEALSVCSKEFSTTSVRLIGELKFIQLKDWFSSSVSQLYPKYQFDFSQILNHSVPGASLSKIFLEILDQRFVYLKGLASIQICMRKNKNALIVPLKPLDVELSGEGKVVSLVQIDKINSDFIFSSIPFKRKLREVGFLDDFMNVYPEYLKFLGITKNLISIDQSLIESGSDPEEEGAKEAFFVEMILTLLRYDELRMGIEVLRYGQEMKLSFDNDQYYEVFKAISESALSKKKIPESLSALDRAFHFAKRIIIEDFDCNINILWFDQFIYIGLLYLDLNENEKALEIFDFISTNPIYDENPAKYRFLGSVAIAYQKIDSDRSLQIIDQIQQTAEKITKKNLAFMIFMNLSITCHELGFNEKKQLYFQKCEMIIDEFYSILDANISHLEESVKLTDIESFCSYLIDASIETKDFDFAGQVARKIRTHEEKETNLHSIENARNANYL